MSTTTPVLDPATARVVPPASRTHAPKRTTCDPAIEHSHRLKSTMPLDAAVAALGMTSAERDSAARIDVCLTNVIDGTRQHRTVGWRITTGRRAGAGVVAAETPDALWHNVHTGNHWPTIRKQIDRDEAAQLLAARPMDLTLTGALDHADRLWLVDL